MNLNDIISYKTKKYTKKNVLSMAYEIKKNTKIHRISDTTIAVISNNPVICLASIIGSSFYRNKICILNESDGSVYNKYLIENRNVTAIICDSLIVLESYSDSIHKILVSDIMFDNEDFIDISKHELNIEIVDSLDYILNEKLVSNWNEFNKNTLKVRPDHSLWLYDENMDYNPYVLLSFLFNDGYMDIINIPLESIKKLDISKLNKEYTCCYMPLRTLQSIKNSNSIVKFKHIISYGNDLIDLNNFKVYCKDNGILWHNYYGNNILQMISTVKKRADNSLYHIGKEIKNYDISIRNCANGLLPIGVQGEVFIKNEKAEKYDWIKTGYLGKRIKDGFIEFCGYIEDIFLFNSKEYSLKHIKNMINTELNLVVLYADYVNESFNIYYDGSSEVTISQIDDFSKLKIPKLFPSINWYAIKPGTMKYDNKDTMLSYMDILKLKKQVLGDAKWDFRVKTLDSESVLQIFSKEKDSSLFNDDIKIDIIQYLLQRQFCINKIEFYCIDKLINSIHIEDYYNFTKHQQEIINIWKYVLKIDNIGLNDNFFNIGGNSILFIDLISRLSVFFNHENIQTQLLLNPTLSNCIKLIENGDCNEVQSFEEKIEKSLCLDNYVKNIKYARNIKSNKKMNIFLTGANGFVGTYLLKELLRKTDSIVYCLIRDENKKNALNKIKDAMKYYEIDEHFIEERIVVILGDLGKEYFGLEFNTYKMLCNKIDVIIHNAAMANYMYSYDMLENVNVIGTGRIIDLATTSKIKSIQFISSTAIFGPLQWENEIVETTPLQIERLPRTGYVQSKWSADTLIQKAQKLGIPCNIFRLGNICGDEKNGICQPKDFLWMIIKLGIEIHKLPYYFDIPFYFTTVSSIASSIVSITKSQIEGKIFHLIDEPLKYTRIIEWIKEYGISFEMEDYNKWLSDVKEYTSKIDNKIFKSVPIIIDIDEDLNQEVKFIQFNNSYSQVILEQLNEKVYFMDKETFKKHLDHFILNGFINKEKIKWIQEK